MITTILKRISFIAAITLIFFASPVFASYYKNCVYPNEMMGVDVNNVNVPPMDSVCANQCQSDCSATFSFTNAHGETSNDLIQSCIQSCKNGSAYTATPRVGSNNFPLWKNAASASTVTSSCATLPSSGATQQIISSGSGSYVIDFNSSGSIADWYFVVDPGIKVDSGTFTISFNDALTNSGYMCGSSSAYMYPALDNNGTIGLVSGAPSPAGTPNVSYWNSRSSSVVPLPVPTGQLAITPQQGDYLSVTYMGTSCPSGDCSYDCANSGAANCQPYDRDLVMVDGFQNSTTLPGDSMTLMQCSTPTGSPNSPNCPVTTSCSSPPCLASNILNGSDASAPFYLNSTKYGLTGVYTQGYRSIDNQNQRFDIVNFAGTLSNFSTVPTSLSFQYPGQRVAVYDSGSDCCYKDLRGHHVGRCYNSWQAKYYTCCQNRNDVDTGWDVCRLNHYNSVYNAATGGMIVKVDWRGCPFAQDNPQLQYAVMPNNGSYGNLTWTNVSIDAVIAVTSSGKLVFRIAPGSAPSPGYVGGGYNIVVKKSAMVSGGAGLDAVVNAVSAQLFGTGAVSNNITAALNNAASSSGAVGGGQNAAMGGGVVQRIFTNLSQDSSFISLVRGVLVLYIAYVGLSFMMGTSAMNQQEALSILLRIGIVLTLISSSSWDFFNTYVFSFIRNISTQMISAATVNYASYNIPSNGQAIDLFKFLDATLEQVFSNVVWVKILALICSGLTGWVIAVSLVLGITMFILFIFKVVMVYLTSLIAMAILTIVAPLFIAFSLFKYTQTMFTGWVKLYISFALQPVFVVAAASVMSDVTVYVLNSSLYFTACSVCLLGFSMSGADICLLPFYMTVDAMHAPGPASLESAVPVIEVIFMLNILVTLGNAICDHLTSLASEIATGSANSLNLAFTANAIGEDIKYKASSAAKFGYKLSGWGDQAPAPQPGDDNLQPGAGKLRPGSGNPLPDDSGSGASSPPLHPRPNSSLPPVDPALNNSQPPVDPAPNNSQPPVDQGSNSGGTQASSDSTRSDGGNQQQGNNQP